MVEAVDDVLSLLVYLDKREDLLCDLANLSKMAELSVMAKMPQIMKNKLNPNRAPIYANVIQSLPISFRKNSLDSRWDSVNDSIGSKRLEDHE